MEAISLDESNEAQETCIAIVGAGLIGRAHLSYFEKVGIKCCGLVDPSPLAADFGT